MKVRKLPLPEDFKTDLQVFIRPGTLVNQRYEIIELIGEGGFGTIYRGHDRELGREVSLKFLKDFYIDSQLDLKRFTREARLMAQLLHPNIVRVFSVDMNEQQVPFIVMEYLQGENLSTIIKQTPNGLDPDSCQLLFRQIASGLAYAHELEIIHRDLSPANVVVVGSANERLAKLLDFGLARICDDAQIKTQTLTATGVLAGNPSYMSPEACRGEKADRVSDIYSLGCLLYEMLSGKAPFQNAQALNLLHKHLSEFPSEPKLNWQDKILESKYLNITLKCLQKEREKRFQTVNELISALDMAEPISCRKLRSWESKDYRGRESNLFGRPLVWLAMGAAAASLLVLAANYGKINDARKIPGLETEESLAKESSDKKIDRLISAKDDYSQSGWIRQRNEAYELSLDKTMNVSIGKRQDAAFAYAESLIISGLPNLGLKVASDAMGLYDKKTGKDTGKLGSLHLLKLMGHLCLAEKERSILELKEISSLSSSKTQFALSSAVYLGHESIFSDCNWLDQELLKQTSDINELLRFADAYFFLGRLDLAERSLKKAFRLDSDKSYQNLIEIYRARLAVCKGDKKQAAMLWQIVKDSKAGASDTPFGHFLAVEMGKPVQQTAPNDDGLPVSSASIEDLKNLLAQSRGWREIDRLIDRLLASEKDPVERCRLLCLQSEIKGRDIYSTTAEAYRLCKEIGADKVPRELHLRASFLYAKVLMQRGNHQGSRKLLQELEADLIENGFPAHEDYGLAIDRSLLDNIGAMMLRSYFDSGDKESAERLFELQLTKPMYERMVEEMLKVDLSVHAGKNLSLINKGCADSAGAIYAARFLIRHGMPGRAREFLSTAVKLSEGQDFVERWDAAILSASYEALSYLEESKPDLARGVLLKTLGKVGEVDMSELQKSKSKKYGRRSLSETRTTFWMALQLSGLKSKFDECSEKIQSILD